MSTPGGILRRIFDVFSLRPAPLQRLQGFSMVLPDPSHRGQVWVKVKIPRDVATCPLPRQVVQLTLREPGAAPLP